jgi:RNA polymerase sigma-70 factor (ECF subfamily)
MLSAADRAAAQELVKRTLQDDLQSFGELMLMFWGRLIAFVRCKFHFDQDTAADVVTRTFDKAKAILASYDESKSSVSTWLHLIAESLAISEIRRWKSVRNPRPDWVESLSRFEDSDPPDRHEPTGPYLPVRLALESLPKKWREPIWMRFFEEYGTDEIAELLQCPRRTVQDRIRKGLKKLGQLPRILRFKPKPDEHQPTKEDAVRN